jgi:hypothetical protein
VGDAAERARQLLEQADRGYSAEVRGPLALAWAVLALVEQMREREGTGRGERE